MEIDEHLAIQVVKRLRQEIPYNINVMNKKGVIIASGETKRVGQLHEGAVEAIAFKRNNIIEKNQANGILNGYNMPIVVRDEIIGVVGITGDPKQLTYIAPLVKVTTELLSEQAIDAQQIARKKRRIERFVLKWLSLKAGGIKTSEFLKEAHLLDVHLKAEYQIIIVQTTDIIHQYLDTHSYKIRLNNDELVVITYNPKVLNAWENLAQKNQYRYGISQPCLVLDDALNQARNVILYHDILAEKTPIYTTEMTYIDSLKKANIDVDNYVSKLAKLQEEKSGLELLKTLQNYFKYNGNITAVAQHMHIHRNTLHYRLTQIKRKIGLDPYRYNELVMLYIALIYYQTR